MSYNRRLPSVFYERERREQFESIAWGLSPHSPCTVSGEELARAGFYPTGIDNQVVCAFGGCELFVSDDMANHVGHVHWERFWMSCPMARGYDVPNIYIGPLAPFSGATAYPPSLNLSVSSVIPDIRGYFSDGTCYAYTRVPYGTPPIEEEEEEEQEEDFSGAWLSDLQYPHTAGGYLQDDTVSVSTISQGVFNDNGGDFEWDGDSMVFESSNDASSVVIQYESEEEEEEYNPAQPIPTLTFTARSQETASPAAAAAANTAEEAAIALKPFGIIMETKPVCPSQACSAKRRESFEAHPNLWVHAEKVSPSFMAEAGFTLMPTNDRPMRAQCFHCALHICEWPSDLSEQQVEKMHLELSPECKRAQLRVTPTHPPSSGSTTIDLACVCCLTNRAEVAFLGCGHLAACSPCAYLVSGSSCPLCRKPVVGFIRIFTA